MDIGQKELDDKLDEIMNNLAANQCCSILFTVRKITVILWLAFVSKFLKNFFWCFQSGTTSAPKAVMLSHDNWVFDAKMVIKYLKLKTGCERYMSYLPLSHAAAQVCWLFLLFPIHYFFLNFHNIQEILLYLH